MSPKQVCDTCGADVTGGGIFVAPSTFYCSVSCLAQADVLGKPMISHNKPSHDQIFTSSVVEQLDKEDRLRTENRYKVARMSCLINAVVLSIAVWSIGRYYAAGWTPSGLDAWLLVTGYWLGELCRNLGIMYATYRKPES